MTVINLARIILELMHLNLPPYILFDLYSYIYTASAGKNTHVDNKIRNYFCAYISIEKTSCAPKLQFLLYQEPKVNIFIIFLRQT